YFSCIFVCPCSRARRDLHSFPTRRSSDLNGALVQAVIHATGKQLRTSAGKPDPAIFLQAAKSLKINSPVVIGDRLDTDILGANRDRKSTRLNSSHVSISYAVFCLKKKRNI